MNHPSGARLGHLGENLHPDLHPNLHPDLHPKPGRLMGGSMQGGIEAGQGSRRRVQAAGISPGYTGIGGTPGVPWWEIEAVSEH
jgi:hypothetical protein